MSINRDVHSLCLIGLKSYRTYADKKSMYYTRIQYVKKFFIKAKGIPKKKLEVTND